jgi:hypothetical protein
MYVSQPMTVGGWPGTDGPYGTVRLWGYIDPEHRRCECCEPYAEYVRRMIAVYGLAFFSDGMGV